MENQQQLKARTGTLNHPEIRWLQLRKGKKQIRQKNLIKQNERAPFLNSYCLKLHLFGGTFTGRL